MGRTVRRSFHQSVHEYLDDRQYLAALCSTGSFKCTYPYLQSFRSFGMCISTLSFYRSLFLQQFIMSIIKALHSHRKPALLRRAPLNPDDPQPQGDRPVIYLSNRWYLRLLQHLVYLLARKRTKIAIRFLAIICLVPIGAAIPNDTIVIILFSCVILPGAVILDWAGNSSGIASLVQRIGDIGRPKAQRREKVQGPQRQNSWIWHTLTTRFRKARPPSSRVELQVPLLPDGEE